MTLTETSEKLVYSSLFFLSENPLINAMAYHPVLIKKSSKKIYAPPKVSPTFGGAYIYSKNRYSVFYYRYLLSLVNRAILKAIQCP